MRPTIALALAVAPLAAGAQRASFRVEETTIAEVHAAHRDLPSVDVLR